METHTRPMTVSIDDETAEICIEIRKRHLNRSSVIRDLLRLYRDNGYQVPVISTAEAAPDHEIGPDDVPYGDG